VLAVKLVVLAGCVSEVQTHDASVPSTDEADGGVDHGTGDAGKNVDRAKIQQWASRLFGDAGAEARGVFPPAELRTVGDLRNCSSGQACILPLGSTSFQGEPVSLFVDRFVVYEHRSATGGMRALTFLVGLREQDGGRTEQWRLMIGLEEYFWRDMRPPYEVNVVDEPFLRPDGGLAIRSARAERGIAGGPPIAPPGRPTWVPREINLQPYRGIVIPEKLKPQRIKSSDRCLTIGHTRDSDSEDIGSWCLSDQNGCLTLVNGCRTTIDVEGFEAHVSWNGSGEEHPARTAGAYRVTAPCVIPSGGWAYLDDSIDRFGFALWRPRCSVREIESQPP
jgi:hypothetical protein